MSEKGTMNVKNKKPQKVKRLSEMSEKEKEAYYKIHGQDRQTTKPSSWKMRFKRQDY